MDAIHSPVKLLTLQLEQSGRDFICTTSLPDTSASVRFVGQFMGNSVVWDMHLTHLSSYRKTPGNPAAPCPFIEIKAVSDDVYPVTVVLDLPTIDEPVIKKTIIMLRNYKRLVIGKIEFCPQPAEA